ncbi:inositol monophosphatase [Halobacteriales archaeon QH_10_67_22]|nr:MAG: inositol monophosphatase [Halobacteriales archaeon QH_10_67_22]
MNDGRIATVTREAARAGADVAIAAFRTTLDVGEKDGKTDLVTVTDRETQDAVVDRIRETFPEDTVYGEEDGTDGYIPDTGRGWVIDPIDGTNNFVRGNRRFATSVACVRDGEPVAAANVLPAMDDTYVGTPGAVTRNGSTVSVSERSDPDLFQVVPTIWWGFDRRGEFARATEAVVERFGDLRRLGSAQAALSMLAGGGVEGVITNVETNAWDTVAGAAMVEWAGGTVTDLDGDPWQYDARGLVASNGRNHDAVLAAARQIDGTDPE